MSLSLPREKRILTAVLADAVGRYPARTFLQFGDREVTYEEFDRMTDTAAAGFLEHGLQPGGKLAIMTRNCLEFVVAWFATAKIGVIYVPINTEYRGSILAWQLGRAEVSHMLIEEQFVAAVQHVSAQLPGLKKLFVIGESTGRATISVPEQVPFEQVLKANGAIPDIEIAHSSPLAISFTSGTTGPSKGVLATHCHVLTFALDWIRAVDLSVAECIYTPLPLFHAIAAWLGVVPALLTGGRIAIAERFSASNYWKDVTRFKADVTHGVFSMVPMLLKQPVQETDALQPARRFYIGRHEPEFHKRFNCEVVEVFGSTETGIVTMTPPGERAPAGSCGKANQETFEVLIADDNDEPVAPGAVGEILVRPRHPFGMFAEYYGAPEATLGAFRNQWFHTGDNARMDEDGWVYFVDRKKDAIRRRGENISSYEVESVLLGIPEVLECAAVAASSELGEDEVKVVIVPRPGATLTPEEVWAYCDEHMPRFWVPRFVEFRDALPKTPTAKVQKHLLREAAPNHTTHERQVASRSATFRK